MELCCLTDPNVPVVADTSTLINLSATGCALKILSALPNRLVAMDVVLEEITNDVRSGRSDTRVVSNLVEAKLIQVASLAELHEGHFETLVVGPTAQTLDDGEAATLAYATEKGATVLIDERKAIRIGGERFPQLKIGSSVDLFTHSEVRAALGAVELGAAVYKALHDARMRVLPHHLDWILDLIGTERAAACSSLPRRVRTQMAEDTGDLVNRVS